MFEVVVILGNIGESAANRKMQRFIERGKKVQLIRESRTTHIADGMAETKNSMKDLKDRTQIPQLLRPSPRPADIFGPPGDDHEGVTVLLDDGKKQVSGNRLKRRVERTRSTKRLSSDTATAEGK